MLRFIIIAIILIIIYVVFVGLMKAAGKDTPIMPDNNHNEDKDN